mgnify:CR=1 FL=1|jgi:hypothetical protein
MKRITTLFILLTLFNGNAQCPSPSNLTYSTTNSFDALLSWTENGTANTWDIAVVPDFYVGAPLPSNGWISAYSNPFLLVGLTPYCNVFFVRSVCSTTEVSPWIAVASSACSLNVFNYLATLSNNSFSMDNENIKIFPNPSSNLIQITTNSKIDKITLFDTLGKEILTQTQNTTEVNIEKLSKGLYIVEIFSKNEKVYKKIIKE